MNQERIEKIKEYLIDNFLDDDEEIVEDTSLFQDKILDSVQLSQLIIYLESEFQLKVASMDIVYDNFDSLKKMDAYIDRKLGRKVG